MRVFLDHADGLSGYVMETCDGRSVLIQTDWDYPGVASRLGYVACRCGATDGTVDCQHQTASRMITRAAEFLDRRAGRSFYSKLDDYFQAEE